MPEQERSENITVNGLPKKQDWLECSLTLRTSHKYTHCGYHVFFWLFIWATACRMAAPYLSHICMTVEDVHWILILFICLFKNEKIKKKFFVFGKTSQPSHFRKAKRKKGSARRSRNRKKANTWKTFEWNEWMNVMIADVFVDAGCTLSKRKWRESIVVKVTKIQWFS